jgi:hypothetical protein
MCRRPETGESFNGNGSKGSGGGKRLGAEDHDSRNHAPANRSSPDRATFPERTASMNCLLTQNQKGRERLALAAFDGFALR